MAKIENIDTRYFIEIEVRTLKVIGCEFDQKQYLNKGRQNNPEVHRVFISKGQYNKFFERCGNELESVF